MARLKNGWWWIVAGFMAIGLVLTGWANRSPAYAADCVAGPHSGTLTASQDWCPEHNPHIINGTVIVPKGVTLTLRPGVVVRANSGTWLQVTGILTAIGTAAQPITLTSSADNGPGQWGGIYLTNGEATCAMSPSATPGNTTGGAMPPSMSLTVP